MLGIWVEGLFIIVSRADYPSDFTQFDIEVDVTWKARGFKSLEDWIYEDVL